VLWHGRIQAGHVGVVRKKSFIVGKGKGITCSIGREGFHASGKRKKGAVIYFRSFLYHLQLGDRGRLCVVTWQP
jgi:hypothetical protein